MRPTNKHKDERFSSLITKFAGEYFSVEANSNILMTITRTEIEDKGKRATIFFTTLPEEKQETTLEFARRKNRDFRKFIMDKKSFGFVPKIYFEIDFGERNRQRIDELLNESTN